MLIQCAPSEDCTAAIFEETFTLVWAAYHLLRAVAVEMVVHLAPLDDSATIIGALKLCFDAIVGDVLIHLVQH